MLKKVFISTFIFSTALIGFSCSEAEKLKKLGRDFKALLDGTYVPDVPKRFKFWYAPDTALKCAELEEKNPKKAKDYYFQKANYSTSIIYRVKCGGYVDKCHYKVNWYRHYTDPPRDKFIESQIVDICKLKEKQDEDEDW